MLNGITNDESQKIGQFIEQLKYVTLSDEQLTDQSQKAQRQWNKFMELETRVKNRTKNKDRIL